MAVAVSAFTAYFTTAIRMRSERGRLTESWRSEILNRYHNECGDFQKVAQQFAIGVIFYEDSARDGHHEKVFLPKNFNLTIGRLETCDIRSEDRRTSRIHALLSSDNKAVFVEDVFATNPTMVNGKAISGRTKLRTGDTIQAGTLQLKFKQLAGWSV